MCLALEKIHHTLTDALVVKTLAAKLQHAVQARGTAVRDIGRCPLIVTFRVILHYNFKIRPKRKKVVTAHSGPH